MNSDLLNLNSLLWPLVTMFAITSGIFPSPPRIIAQFAQSELFKWFVVYLVIWQGGGMQRVDLSIVATIVAFVLYRLLDGTYSLGLASCPVPLTTTPLVNQTQPVQN